MSDSKNKWQMILDQLAAGKEVDWDTQDISNHDEASMLQQLKSIHAIQRVFAAQNSQNQNVELVNKSILFEWGHLQVLEKLGEGGYGEVFLAFDPILNRDVALKLLKPNQLATFHSKLFIEEAQRIARVRNRHVLAVHGAAVNEGRAGFWSDLIIGNTLAAQSKLETTELLEVAAALADALHAVHQAELIHGDVKAANVMCDQDGQYILMDFGAGLERGTVDSSNHSIGSPMLMAPELFFEAPKSAASDMYAMGCLLFKLASGKYPVGGKNILDIAAAHEQQKYFNLAQLRTDLPASLVALIHRLIEPNPQHRVDASQLIKMLDDIVSEPARKKKKRMILGIIGSLLVGLVMTSLGFYFANVERQKAETEQRKAQAVNDFLQQVLGASFNLGTGREVRVADVLDLAAINALEDFKHQPEILAELTKTLGQSYQNLQVMDKSRDQLSKSLALKKSLLGETHPETLRVMLLLAKTERALGHFQASIELCESVITLSNHDSKLKSYRFDAEVILANSYSSLGDFEQAEVMLTQIIQQAKDESIPSNHLFLALMAQSSNFLKLSNFDAAVSTAQQAIATIKQVKDYKATNLLSANNQLAVALSSQGQYAAAEIIISEQLEMAEQFYGKNNIGYLKVLTNLGANLQSQGKLDQAVAYQEHVVDLTKELYGYNNQITITSQMNLANTYVSLQRLDEGEKLMRQVLLLAQKVIGADHVLTLTIQYNLGELLNKTGRYAESLVLSSDSLELMQGGLGHSHLVTLLTNDNIAVSLAGLQRYGEAQTYFITALTGIENALGQSNPYYLQVKGHQIDTLITAGERQSAIAELRRFMPVQQSVLSGSNEAVIQSEMKLQSLLTNDDDSRDNNQ